jgi:hypothetical protein
MIWMERGMRGGRVASRGQERAQEKEKRASAERRRRGGVY